MTDVFISYKREERPRCVAIYNALVDLKLAVWFDAHIEPGTSFDREIEREVRGSKAILVLWSAIACDSDWIRAEARTGKQANRLVAARLDDCLPPLEFASVQAVDLFDAGNFQSGDGWRQIVARIGRLVDRPGLGDYVRCEQAADAALWQGWLEVNPADPLAAKAQERLAALVVTAPVIAPPAPVPDTARGSEKPGPPRKTATPSPPIVAKVVAEVPENGVSQNPVGDDDIAVDRVGAASAFVHRHRWIALGSIAAVASLWLASGYWTGADPIADKQVVPTGGSLATPGENSSSPPASMSEPIVATTASSDVAAVAEAQKKAPPKTGSATAKIVIPDVSRNNCSPGPYIVYFNWDQSSVTPEAAGTLNLAASRWSECGGDVRIAGHTDREGSTAYNVGLSQRMASSVQQYLAARGIPAGQMSTEAFGESQPRVKTADGVREVQNRRVEVTFGPSSGY